MRLADSKGHCQGCVRISSSKSRSKFSHLLLFELGIRVMFPMSRTISLLGVHVGVVLPDCRPAKVRWIATGRIIAGMHDYFLSHQAFASGYFPSNSMGSGASPRQIKKSIPFLASSFQPRPTFSDTSHCYSRPEAGVSA